MDTILIFIKTYGTEAGTFLGIFITAATFIYTSYQNSRIKTIEFLLLLEEKFKDHIELLVAIESDDSKLPYREALIKESSNRNSENTNVNLSSEEHQIITNIDKMLRHFLICKKTRDSWIGKEVLDDSYRYYLTNVLCSNENKELTAYIQHYWKLIYEWANECR